jgi:molecular chaperone GrpE
VDAFLQRFVPMPDEAVDAPPEEPRASPAAAAAAPPPAEVAPPEEDWATRYKYLLADFENYRRRTERDRESISRQARAGMVRELLPLFEAFRSAREAVSTLPADSPVRRGLDLLDREWTIFLKHEGVEPVAVPGRPFSAAEQEAVGEAPATPEHPAGSIVEVVQQGYRFFGGLLRPAKVIVARDAERPGGEA